MEKVFVSFQQTMYQSIAKQFINNMVVITLKKFKGRVTNIVVCFISFIEILNCSLYYLLSIWFTYNLLIGRPWLRFLSAFKQLKIQCSDWKIRTECFVWNICGLQQALCHAICSLWWALWDKNSSSMHCQQTKTIWWLMHKFTLSLW